MSNTFVRFVKSTPAVESGFLAAGITVSIAAAIESIAIVLAWF